MRDVNTIEEEARVRLRHIDDPNDYMYGAETLVLKPMQAATEWRLNS